MLPWAELWHNYSFNRSIGMTPFLALYGREASIFIELPREEDTNLSVAEEMDRRIEIVELIKINLEKAKEEMKK